MGIDSKKKEMLGAEEDIGLLVQAVLARKALILGKQVPKKWLLMVN